MPDKISLSEIEEQELDGFDPLLKPIGYHLQPEHLRPSIWEYDTGESNREHRHDTQEELYTVLSGKVEITIDGKTIEMQPGDFVAVSPTEWRQVTAIEDSRLLAIGAPNESHDAVFRGGD